MWGGGRGTPFIAGRNLLHSFCCFQLSLFTRCFLVQSLPQLVMPWLRLWSSSTKDEERDKFNSDYGHRKVKPESDDHNSRVTTHIAWTRSSASDSSRNVFTEPQTILAAVVLTTAVLGLRRVYKNYFKRVPEANKIKEAWLGKRSIFGRVTSVGDGDNFRLYHTPGGRLGGWGWLPGRRVPKDKSELRHNTVRQASML